MKINRNATNFNNLLILFFIIIVGNIKCDLPVHCLKHDVGFLII